MDLQLADKVVLITGASGGIGRALTRAFVAEGARVVLHGRRQIEALERWVKDQPWQDRAFVVPADVRVLGEVEHAFNRAAERFGRLDVCVANAGIWYAESCPLTSLPEDRVQDVIGTNLLGAMWSARAFLKALARTGPRADGVGAALVFVGSTAGRFGESGHAAYAAAKAGLCGLVRTLKNEITEIDPCGRVNMVEPGWTVTEMTRDAITNVSMVRRAVRTMPLRQFAAAEDIAAAVMTLASPATARHITGEVLTVAGGMEGRLLWPADQIDVDAIQGRFGKNG